MPPVTPFFADFHRRLFGKAPLSALQERLRHSPQIPSISHYQELFGKLVAPELFLPVQRGTNSRQRIFSPALTFWSFLGQVLEPGSSCRDALRQLNAWWQWHFPTRALPSHDTSGYCQARARLSDSGVESRSSTALRFRCPIPQPIKPCGRKARPKSRAAVFRCSSSLDCFLFKAVPYWI